MKNIPVWFLTCLIFVLKADAQDEFILVNDFEAEIGTWSGWVQFADFTAADEPRHGGTAAVMLDVLHSGGWSDARHIFPEPFDATEADEFRMWVYSDKIFRLRLDLGVEVPLGFRFYGPNDVGTWKEFVYWISEEQTNLWEELLSSTRQLRLWISPEPYTRQGVQYPSGFEGVIYIDDMRLRKRVPIEREYLPLIGFNQQSDAALVSLEYGSSHFEIDFSGDPPPMEGNGTLMFDFTSDWSEAITINLRDLPQIRDYDRIHMDVFVDGNPANWAAMSLILKCSWRDKNGEQHGTGWTTLSENILGSAVGDWGELSGQYGPVRSEGFDNNWLFAEMAGVFDDPDGTLTVTLTTQGDPAHEGTFAYVDNIRLSRPLGAAVHDWELR